MDFGTFTAIFAAFMLFFPGYLTLWKAGRLDTRDAAEMFLRAGAVGVGLHAGPLMFLWWVFEGKASYFGKIAILAARTWINPETATPEAFQALIVLSTVYLVSLYVCALVAGWLWPRIIDLKQLFRRRLLHKNACQQPPSQQA